MQLFSAVESGIALSVAAERYFERAGKRYVLASFTGDAVTYTLFRLLETKADATPDECKEITALRDFADALEKISTNYSHHSKAARAYAELHFDAAKVCADLLQ